MRARIEYEFAFDLGEEHNQEILECIEEDVPEVIQKAMDNIFDETRCTGYRIVKL